MLGSTTPTADGTRPAAMDAVVRAMRCTEVLWHAAFLLLLAAAPAFRIYNTRRLQMPAVEMNCYEVPIKMTIISGPAKIKTEAWRLQKKVKVSSDVPSAVSSTTTSSLLNTHEIQKRFDHLFAEGEDIVKEHAKLVQDINSLRQAVFVAPLVDETRDYDDSVYHENIETSTTTTLRPPMPTTPAPKRLRTTGIPILLVGGASQRQTVVKTPTPPRPRPTISLVGSSASPMGRHPYPFVGQATASAKPYRLCMPSLPMVLPSPTTMTQRRPSLWSRLLSFFPRLTG